MALIPHTIVPRSMLDMDKWAQPIGHGSNTLELFDPFDQLDHMMSRNLQWLHRPDFGFPTLPPVPQKYRIVVECAGFDPKSITTTIGDNKLVVTAHEEVKHDTDNFSVKEFKKTYELPNNAESDKLVSFMTPDGNLVLEVPLRGDYTYF
jgi:HSP20 family molecular chaperone IbpA